MKYFNRVPGLRVDGEPLSLDEQDALDDISAGLNIVGDHVDIPPACWCVWKQYPALGWWELTTMRAFCPLHGIEAA